MFNADLPCEAAQAVAQTAPSTTAPMNVATCSAEETRAAGKAFAERLQPGDVVLLSGDLGAGKTQFAQGVAAGLYVEQVPISPTFNIVISYHSGSMPLHHFDLYRLDSRSQLEDIGLPEYMESGGVCLVEWAEKFPGAFEATYTVDIAKTSDDGRNITITPRRVATAPDDARAARDGWGGTPAGPDWDGRGDMPQAPDEDGRGEARHAPERDNGGETPVSPLWDDGGGAPDGPNRDGRFLLAFDTANEVVAIGVGRLDSAARSVQVVATRQIAAHRASNTTLVPAIGRLLDELGIARDQITCVCSGRGPGSFTGVRICMAAAKGMAQALGVGLVGVSTLDAIAWNAQAHGVRGDLLVVADAMRKEVYPVQFALNDDGVERLSADRVVKAADYAGELARAAGQGEAPPAEESGIEEGATHAEGPTSTRSDSANASYATPRMADLQITGDALVKYRDLFEPAGTVLSDKLWEITGRGLLLAFRAAWQEGQADPFDAFRHDPAFALPVYTRLSDAEENERAKLARNDERNLRTGVQDADGESGRATMHSQAWLSTPADGKGVSYHPLDARHAREVAALEAQVMGTDAWNEKLVADELGQRNRTWWVAESDGALAGYAGGLVVDGDAQILKVAVHPAFRRRGIACELLRRVAEDARNLGASTCSLEVRTSNLGAQRLYETLGLKSVGKRPGYYSDREDAIIMSGPLPESHQGVAGMQLQHLEAPDAGHGALQAGRPSGEEPAAGQMRSGEAEAGRKAGPHGEGALPGEAALQDEGALQGERTLQGEGALPGEGASRDESAVQAERAPLILAIESSCDETAAAVVDGRGVLLSDVVASQVNFHARFGGVVPEIASRKHIEAICGVCAEALESAGVRWEDLGSVAVTYAPGLLGALVVGVAFAKGAAWALDVPFIGVNHLEGHLYANKMGAPDFQPPAVVSLVSGGNTLLVHMRDWGDYEVLGETIDDAVGEAFDKVAKALGLGYPGGPAISKQAERGRADAIAFPRAMMHSHDLRFSLSGLKTAVVNHINGERNAGRQPNIPNIAASFQQAVIDVQVAKARTALQQTGARTFCLGGGVAANPALRAAYVELCAEMDVRLVMPPLASCGDNAGMIALVALDRFRAGRFFPLNADAQAHANLAEPY